MLFRSLPVIGGGAGNPPAVGTVLGSGTKFVTAGAGTPSTDDCAKFDSSHNLVSAGAGCNTSSLTTLGALIYASANQSIPTSTNTAILFNGEVRDDGTLHSTVSNTSKIVIPTGGHGWWHFSGHVAYSTASQTGLRYLWVSRNGIDNVIGPCRSNKDSLNSSSELNVSCDYYASDADEFELVVHQQSGGSLDILSTTSGSEKVSPTFSAVRVSQ